MIRLIIIVALALQLGGCAAAIIGAGAGAVVYHYECWKWVRTSYGWQHVYVCQGKHYK